MEILNDRITIYSTGRAIAAAVAILYPHHRAIVRAIAWSAAIHLAALAIPLGGTDYHQEKPGALRVLLSAPSNTGDPNSVAARLLADAAPNETPAKHDVSSLSKTPPAALSPIEGPSANREKTDNQGKTVRLSAAEIATGHPATALAEKQAAKQSAPEQTAYFRLDELTTSPRMSGAPEIDQDAVAHGSNKKGGIIALRVFVSSNGLIDDIQVLENSLSIEAKASVIEAFRAVRFSPGLLGTRPVPSQLDYEIDIGNLSTMRSRSNDSPIWSIGKQADKASSSTSQ